VTTRRYCRRILQSVPHKERHDTTLALWFYKARELNEICQDKKDSVRHFVPTIWLYSTVPYKRVNTSKCLSFFNIWVKKVTLWKVVVKSNKIFRVRPWLDVSLYRRGKRQLFFKRVAWDIAWNVQHFKSRSKIVNCWSVSSYDDESSWPTKAGSWWYDPTLKS